MADKWRYSYEPLRTRVYEGVIAAITCTVPAALAVAVTRGALRYVVVVVAVLGGAWSVKRAFRLGLWASSERVRVQNYWRTREFSWSDVTDIGVGKLMTGVVPQSAWAFLLRDGRSIRAQATPTRPDVREAESHALLALAPAAAQFHRPGDW
jgi:hypothetical protein